MVIQNMLWLTLQEMIGEYESEYFHVNGLILESQKR